MKNQELTHGQRHTNGIDIPFPPSRKSNLATGSSARWCCDPLKIIVVAIYLCLPALSYGEEQTIKPEKVNTEKQPKKTENSETEKQTIKLENENTAEQANKPEYAKNEEQAIQPKTADTKEKQASKEKPVDTSLSMEALGRLIEEQRSLLEQQGRKMSQQDRKLKEQEIQLENQRKEIMEQQKSLEGHVTVLNSLQTQFDQLAMNQGELSSASEEDKAVLNRLQTLEEQLAAIPEDPTLSRDNEVRPGSIALPGTNAYLKIGGYVKLALIKSFDPLESVDRFIVGSIPVSSDGTVSFDESSMSSSQSRLNLDLNS